MAAVGIATGAVAAMLAGRSLQSMLFGIVPADPLVLGSSGAAMLLVVVAATMLPATRASRADPNRLLRAE